MARIHEYRPDTKTRKADTLRRQLTTDLAKSLAFQKSGKTDQAESWAQRLWRHMVKAKLLSGGDWGAYRQELRRSLREDP